VFQNCDRPPLRGQQEVKRAHEPHRGAHRLRDRLQRSQRALVVVAEQIIVPPRELGNQCAARRAGRELERDRPQRSYGYDPRQSVVWAAEFRASEGRKESERNSFPVP
jgi:hypothetical protein